MLLTRRCSSGQSSRNLRTAISHVDSDACAISVTQEVGSTVGFARRGQSKIRRQVCVVGLACAGEVGRRQAGACADGRLLARSVLDQRVRTSLEGLEVASRSLTAVVNAVISQATRPDSVLQFSMVENVVGFPSCVEPWVVQQRRRKLKMPSTLLEGYRLPRSSHASPSYELSVIVVPSSRWSPLTSMSFGGG